MRKILFLILIPLLLLSSAVFAVDAPQVEIVDDFESYATTAALRSAWPAYDGSPSLALSTVAHAGGKSMKIDYDVQRDPFVNWVSFELPEETDWSGMASLSIWYQGMRTNSADTLSLQILDDTNNVLFQDNLPGATADLGWNRWNPKLSGSLGGADAVVIGIEASISEVPGKGTIYLDDISVSNGLRTVWLGNTAEWDAAENWSRGVPTISTDVRIPSAPSGGLFPVVSDSGAAAHDLLIEPDASLDLAKGRLEISGAFINKGVVIRVKPVGSDREKPFLLDGGHPGVMIDTSAPAGAGADAASGALGETSVAIVAGRTCIGGGGSVKRCYYIAPTNEVSSTITFYFNQSDLNGQNCRNLALYNFSNNAWQEVAGPGDANITYQCKTANFSVTVSGIADYSPFLLSDAVPVAISLQSLEAASIVPLSPVLIAAGLLALTALVLRRRS